MDEVQQARIIKEGRRRLFVRLEVLNIAPETIIEEGAIGADFDNEVVPKAEHYFVQGVWIHPLPREIEAALPKQTQGMGAAIAEAIRDNRTDLDFRTLQQARVFSRDSETGEEVKPPDGVDL
jgi:hypothetical protein